MFQNGPRGNPAPPPRPSGISALSNLVSHAVAPVEHVAQVVQHSAPARAYIAAHSAPAPRPTAPSPRLAAAIASRPASSSHAASSRAASSSAATTRLASRIAAALRIVDSAGSPFALLPPNIGSPYGYRTPNEGLDWLPKEGFVFPHTTLPDSLPGRPGEGHKGEMTYIQPLDLAPHVPGVSQAEQQFLHGFGFGSQRGFKDLGLARPRPGHFIPLGRRSNSIQYE